MKQLVALDWGTSSLRAARLDAQGGVIEERSLPRGILTVPAGEFPKVFAEATAQWPADKDTLFLLSGMVGSRQGWKEAPYCPCPAGFGDIAAALAWVEPGRIAIVPGMSYEQEGVPDVMRGEETQVFGAMQLLGITKGLFVLPGTHSKWAHVSDGRIKSFSTFMTGEFYALLRQHSILSRTLPPEDGEIDVHAFERGVHYAMHTGNLMHTAFSVRALALFDKMAAAAMPSYLSGLVIGEELRSQHLSRIADPIVIVAGPGLSKRYELAMQLLDIPAKAVGAEATWRGLWGIAKGLEAA
ncbi:2-dehydro-3-deoxygalactonokinase [Ramlibacter sp. WS9]|uniref:2-dehydro-3-deoxygalactonokinase n=1 Tax=Ramlibacter sp. WS9 TaxID=1882741 RepID=UPI001143E580|nr:2-dehydro-3-deoxygalactonokinase [Ramlibacter sp. WS9]ROZ69633.1 2-dehydro-3-deoxygalactonokinase [Ramlibacter sp. WS9]